MIRGLDASSVQGPLPFAKLDPDIRFCILKAQQGNDGFDPWFGRNMKAALTNGLVPFAYCFAYPLPPQNPGSVIAGGIPGRDPCEQAKLCVDRVHAYPEMIGRPLFLDLEWPPPNEWAKWGCTAEQISEWCRVFCAEVARLSGVTPVIYTYPWWWAEVSKADTSWAACYPLWLASYPGRGVWPKEGESPKVPRPWIDWLFWQWDGDGGLKLPNGVDSDFCVFNGTEEELQGLVQRPAPANDVSPVEPGSIIRPPVPLPEIPTISRDPDDEPPAAA